MKRPIEFRAKIGGDIIYRDHLIAEGLYNLMITSVNGCPVEWMEYAGITDRDGFKVFEDDIVVDQWGDEYVVTFDMGGFYGKHVSGDSDRDINIFHEEALIRVIGNVHSKQQPIKQ